MDHLELTLGSSTRRTLSLKSRAVSAMGVAGRFSVSLSISRTISPKRCGSHRPHSLRAIPLVYVGNVLCDVIVSKSAGATLRSPASSCTTSDPEDVTPLIDCVSRYGGVSCAPLCNASCKTTATTSCNCRLLPYPLESLPIYLCPLLFGPVPAHYCVRALRAFTARRTFGPFSLRA
ncbi:hypothetical protein C8R47DRAFT_1169534 [Mycena vitilis]|nr:hypothetical protein C8R47DRAFT_1169534 [Mycena vitilis]